MQARVRGLGPAAAERWPDAAAGGEQDVCAYGGERRWPGEAVVEGEPSASLVLTAGYGAFLRRR